ncbi:hypothetical protein ACHAQH_000156 [Verticillium albo-atrum]
MGSFTLIAVFAAYLILISPRRERYGFIAYIGIALIFWEAKFGSIDTSSSADIYDIYEGPVRHSLSANWMIVEDEAAMAQTIKKFLERAPELELLEMTLERNILLRELRQADMEVAEMKAREVPSRVTIPTLSTVVTVTNVTSIAPVVSQAPTLTMSMAATVGVILPVALPGPVLALIPPTTTVAISPVSPRRPSPASPTLTFSTIQEVSVAPGIFDPILDDGALLQGATLEMEDSLLEEFVRDEANSQSEREQYMPAADDKDNAQDDNDDNMEGDDDDNMDGDNDDNDTPRVEYDHEKIFDRSVFDMFRDKSDRKSSVVDHDDQEMDDAPRSRRDEQSAIVIPPFGIPENLTPGRMDEVMEREAPAVAPQLPTGPDAILPLGVEHPMIDAIQSQEVEMSEEVSRDKVAPTLEVTQPEQPPISPFRPTTPFGDITQPAEPDRPSQDIKPPAPITEVSVQQAQAVPVSSEESPKTSITTITASNLPAQAEATPERAAATTAGPVPSAVSEPSPAPSAPETPAGSRKLLRRKPKDPNAIFVSRNTIARRKVNLGAGRKAEYEKEAKSSPPANTAPPRTSRDELAPLPATPQPPDSRPRPRPSEEEDEDRDLARKTPAAAAAAAVVRSPPQQGPVNVVQRRLFAPKKSRFSAQQTTAAHAAELADRQRLDAALALRCAEQEEKEKEENREKQAE